MWGAATAAHQVEGGNRWNDWWEFEQAGRLPYKSEDACRHFELFERDFDLARGWGHNAHRFSIEWSRVEPREGEWDFNALEHYREVVSALRQRGMEPLVTLHHFTSPAWFGRAGGWAAERSIERFARYVEVVAEQLKHDVRWWITINEPTVYVKHAFVRGNWPPCWRNSWGAACRAMRNLCHAHRAAYEVLHRHRSDAMVGLAHSAPLIMPRQPPRLVDRAAASAREFVLNRAPIYWAGGILKRRFDFIGLNYYGRSLVYWDTRGEAILFGRDWLEDDQGQPRQYNEMGWEIYPQGLKQQLARFTRYGLPLVVTENGVATGDEQLRANYLRAHLRSLAEAISDGIPVLGYFYWTLMDNFEWSLGTAPRFGLAETDFATQERRPRPVAAYFESVCRRNELPCELALHLPSDEENPTRPAPRSSNGHRS